MFDSRRSPRGKEETTRSLCSMCISQLEFDFSILQNKCVSIFCPTINARFRSLLLDLICFKNSFQRSS